MRVHYTQNIRDSPLVHIHQKKEIVLEIAAKIASVNGSELRSLSDHDLVLVHGRSRCH
jgi:hypothetical protein